MDFLSWSNHRVWTKFAGKFYVSRKRSQDCLTTVGVLWELARRRSKVSAKSGRDFFGLLLWGVKAWHESWMMMSWFPRILLDNLLCLRCLLCLSKSIMNSSRKPVSSFYTFEWHWCLSGGLFFFFFENKTFQTQHQFLEKLIRESESTTTEIRMRSACGQQTTLRGLFMRLIFHGRSIHARELHT